MNDQCSVCKQQTCNCTTTTTKDLAGYLKTMTDINGCSVVTVKDGWVLLFNKEKLQRLIAETPVSNDVLIFVKSSANVPKN